MSYAELKVVTEDGTVRSELELRNAWGYAARIWNDLFDHYAKDPDIPYDTWLSDKGNRLWRLAEVDDGRVEYFERQILRSTFDNAMVRREDFQIMADRLRAFIDKYPANGKVCHLEIVAKRLESLKDDQSIIAACWQHTSVSEDPWFGQFGPDEYCETCGQLREDIDEQPYNINTGDKHWFVNFHKPSGSGR